MEPMAEEQSTEFDRFKDLLRRLARVRKNEVEELEADEEQETDEAKP